MKKQICASFVIALFLASCGGGASQTPLQSSNKGATGSTAPPGVRVNLDTIGPCELLTQADADKIYGKPLISHKIVSQPIQDLGNVNACAYSDMPSESASGVPGSVGISAGVGTNTKGTNSLASMLANGGKDLSSMFGLPAVYSVKNGFGRVAVVLDPTHALVSIAAHADPSGRPVPDETQAIAVIRAELHNIR